MKVAIIGSRGLGVIGLETFLPDTVTEIVSGGAILTFYGNMGYDGGGALIFERPRFRQK